MGYRCYIHPVDGTETNCGKDACIGKLIGYVDDDHINDLSVLPFIAFGLQYGQQNGADMDIDTFDDVRVDCDRWMIDTLGEYMDIIHEQRVLLPWYMLLPFLIAYYNDQQRFYIQYNKQRFYIQYNKQPLLDPAKLPQAVQTVLAYYSDITPLYQKWESVQYFLIYWC